MSTGGRPMLRATVEPLAALVVVSRCESILEETAHRFERVGTPREVEAAASVRRALAELRESARNLRRNLDQAWERPEVGTAEPGSAVRGAGSVSPPTDYLTVSQVAGMCGISEGFVRRLCRDRVLPATREGAGRPWRIDPDGFADFKASRSVT